MAEAAASGLTASQPPASTNQTETGSYSFLGLKHLIFDNPKPALRSGTFQFSAGAPLSSQSKNLNIKEICCVV